MGPWNNSNKVARADALNKIKALADEQGIKGAYKVFYNDAIVPNPEDLPEQVDMDLVRVSAVLDQA